MKYQLMQPTNDSFSAVETVLTNRGIELEEINHYLNTTDDDINDFMLLGSEELHQGYQAIVAAMDSNLRAVIIIDSDCDGYTSAAVLTNYLHDLKPEWVEDYVSFIIHAGKQHGLSGVEIADDISLVIVPDAGSNDYDQHKELKTRGKTVLVLDHHEAEYKSKDAIVVNNQLSDYPNKALSGVGVVWQFCRYFDYMWGAHYADKYLDLVALGLDADMMSLTSLETKHLINKGFKQVTNPFFTYMAEKNSYSLKGKLTPIGVAFYIAPLVNSMVRSGTAEEKRILFESMLNYKAFDKVPSTKRGSKPGDQEKIVEQAIRIATNVKSRQTKAQNSGMEALEGMIVNNNLLDNKVLLFLCAAKSIPPNIAGLVANKFMAKYQRHTAILFNEDGLWRGSARACPTSIKEDFKALCEESGVVEYAQGHPGAFGLAIRDENIEAFIDFTNEALAADSGEAIYYVDYIYQEDEVDGTDILEIASLDNLWGKDMPEALVAVENLKITEDMLTLMSPDKKPTLKIALNNGVTILKFKSSQEEYESLCASYGYVKINLVGTTNQNEWNGTVTPQIFIKDYQILEVNDCYF